MKWYTRFFKSWFCDIVAECLQAMLLAVIVFACFATLGIMVQVLVAIFN